MCAIPNLLFVDVKRNFGPNAFEVVGKYSDDSKSAVPNLSMENSYLSSPFYHDQHAGNGLLGCSFPSCLQQQEHTDLTDSRLYNCAGMNEKDVPCECNIHKMLQRTFYIRSGIQEFLADPVSANARTAAL